MSRAERVEKAIEMLERGHDHDEIAKQLDVSRGTAVQYTRPYRMRTRDWYFGFGPSQRGQRL